MLSSTRTNADTGVRNTLNGLNPTLTGCGIVVNVEDPETHPKHPVVVIGDRSCDWTGSELSKVMVELIKKPVCNFAAPL